MKFITEAEHVHSSSDDYFRQFEELKMRLGMDTGFRSRRMLLNALSQNA